MEMEAVICSSSPSFSARVGTSAEEAAAWWHDTLTLRVDGQRVQLGRSAAQKVWVRAA